MFEKKKKIFLILAGIGLYLLSTGISYATFSYLKVPAPSPLLSPLPSGESKFKVDITAPKTEVCPLNGAKFTKAEKDIWEKRRPLTVMIENHQEARPQSGLSRADIVYEAVAEGGATRFLAVFYCGASALDVQVGPVRSARTYYLDFASEYGDYPLYAHVGGANDFQGTGDTHPKARALEQIQSYGWKLYNDLDSMSLSFPTYWRDYERLGHPVATEHTMYSTTDRLWKVAEQRGLTNVDKNGVSWDKNFVRWKFKEEAKEAEREEKSPEFLFWQNYEDYKVKWEYDKLANDYKRINGGQPQKDRNDDSEIRAKVVIIAFMNEKGSVDRNKHILYETTGSGKAILFQDGKAITATWDKQDRKSRMIFKDPKGKEIELNGGQIWVEILPTRSEVNY